ncbi:hypothetical protein I2I05_06385 [Hymenobacter sp. BT683]|uniref:7TM-DISM receptor extracellular domain-containing protein n=1 Tax=Hymenobacter jeongseonensis TaxID=2791027 RepID=A0ABS0IG57_9BACT|nr:7TM diverse intracellular signaling domain-containing protein [Hymenobacter jeongseonensis]MBF9237019.1 hypothetical protein [Hymenobacter jeongseonensis]
MNSRFPVVLPTNASFVQKTLCVLLFVLLAGLRPVAAQSAAGGVSTVGTEVVRIGVLPDNNYSWERIRTDTSLVFAQSDSLFPARAYRYWLKIEAINRSRYAEATRLTVLPNIDNTLFYFNEDAQAWISQRAGLAVATDTKRMKGRLPLLVQGRSTAIFYVLVNLGRKAALPPAISVRADLEKESAAQETERYFSIAWAVSVAVLLLLLLTNLHVYARSRDRTTLYYICTQVGAALYITAYRGFFRVLFPAPVFSMVVLPSGITYAYTLNNVLMHLSVVLLLMGFVQMTRAYLPTRARLPRLDAGLRYALGGYVAFTVVVGLVNTTGFHLNNYTLLLDNILVLGVLSLLLVTTVVAYLRRLPLARIYLLANVLPLLFIISVAVHHVVLGFNNDGSLLLPDLAVVSHALCFSAAISIRLQNLQRSLLTKEQEAHHLALDIRQKELRNREIAWENQQIQVAFGRMERRQKASELETQQLSVDIQQQQSSNQDLQEKLETNQRELASTTLYVAQKNALLAELKLQIEEMNAQNPHKQKELSGIKSILQTNLYLDDDWTRFKLHFEQVHPRFFEELQAKYPALTKNELRLYSYFHINLSTKEIAALLNIDPASVRRAKTRLYKKIAAANNEPGLAPPDEEADAQLAEA